MKCSDADVIQDSVLISSKTHFSIPPKSDTRFFPFRPLNRIRATSLEVNGRRDPSLRNTPFVFKWKNHCFRGSIEVALK